MPKLTDQQQRKAATEFYKQWNNRSNEKKDTQSFWLDLLRMVYGVENPSQFINFEKTIQFEDSKKFADGYISKTKILIEQKSGDVDLSKGEKQSDGVYLRPDQQARRYANNLPYDEKPKYIITSNFKEIWVYDENRPHSDPEKILVKDLPKEFYRLQFIVDTKDKHIKKEMELSIRAGEIVGEIYNALRAQYRDPDSEESMKSLNKLCVRLVFCLYAEDAGLFSRKSAFHDYLAHYEAEDCREALKRLFDVLNQSPEDRDPYLKEDLASFPYVNGGLFDSEDVEIPHFTEEIRDLILAKASDDFDWSEISPTIFGAVFESTLNPETRRKGGMHYTSIENIHKVIDPLFYDDLCKEFEKIKSIKVKKNRDKELDAFRDKMAGLKFLDPACGSGNFLTETYLSLRRLENEAIQLMQGGKTSFGFLNPIKVHISQFYGIEINDFAVTVAKTALWIAESQMMQETERIMQQDLDFLPLKTYSNIVEENALRVDWNSVVPATELNYIMGNPPFVGFTYMSQKQKADMELLFPGIKNLDFVAGWYKKAMDYIGNDKIDCAFVSTNSITQGETVARFYPAVRMKINFAYSTFIWDNESAKAGKAHVHCIIIGFSNTDKTKKYLYTDNKKKKVKNINPYLIDAPDIIVSSRNKPLCNVSKMIYGNKPADGGFLILTEQERLDIESKEPQSAKFIKPLLGAEEFLHNKKRFVFWLDGAEPSDIKKCPTILSRINGVRETRLKSIAPAIRKFAETPAIFAQITQPVGQPFIIVPRVSSERRKYIPMNFDSGETIVTDAVQIIPNASKYDFGILTSNVHMAWMRAICGRLESRYRYSKDVVYNNFPWPKPTAKQKEKIEKTAQGILDARAKYPNSSLADLYDETTMPPELRKAHQLNDRAVMEAYGFWGKLNSESDCVAELMKMYQKLTEKN